MMQFIHYAPVSALKHIARQGIAVSRRKVRASGVYAFPLVPGLPRTITNQWKRELSSASKRSRLEPIVFNLHSDDVVLYFRDYTFNPGKEQVVRAAVAGQLVLSKIRLQTIGFRQWLDEQGLTEWLEKRKRLMPLFYEQDLTVLKEEYLESKDEVLDSLPEVVVPHRIDRAQLKQIGYGRRPSDWR